jgi:hypothetical protein
MRTIHKFQLDTRSPGPQKIWTDPEARVLHVQAQGTDDSVVSIWVEVDASAAVVEHQVMFFLTGGYPPAHARFIATHLMHGGSFVLHLYDVTVRA